MSQVQEKGSYAVVTDDGVNYRTIADTMCHLGFEMNHSSARNHVLRVMKKLAEAFAKKNGVTLTEEQIDACARSPMFQSGVSSILHRLWAGSDGEALFSKE